jgi:hypothetical protein
MPSTHIEVTTGSNSFILSNSNSAQQVPIANNGKIFRLTLTLIWEEYRQPNQTAGSLWLNYLLGDNTASLSGIEAVVPIENQGPKANYYLIATPGLVAITYNGVGKAHVWLSYYAEIPE